MNKFNLEKRKKDFLETELINMKSKILYDIIIKINQRLNFTKFLFYNPQKIKKEEIQKNKNNIPDFFIVGAPKCGTSSLNNYLGQHPQIYVSPIKEPHFFSTDLNPPSYIRDKDIYLSLFSNVKNEIRIGENSNTYLYSHIAAKKIKEFSPNADIIILLRNPVDMMYSLYWQALSSGIEWIKDFEKALKYEKIKKNQPKNMIKTFTLYKDAAQYREQVERYYDLFENKKIHIIIYKEFKNNNLRIYKELLKFLNVNINYIPQFIHLNPSRHPRSILLAHIIRKIKPRKGSNNDNLSSKLVYFLKLINNNYKKIPPIDIKLRRNLIKEFIPEINRLSKLINKDLTFWYKY